MTNGIAVKALLILNGLFIAVPLLHADEGRSSTKYTSWRIIRVIVYFIY